MPAIFGKIDKLKPVYDIAEYIVMFVCKLLLIADILITCYTVASRYIEALPGAAWTEEVILTLMSYMVVLSAALAIRKNGHIRMTAFDTYLPKVLIKILDVLADLAILLLAYVMITAGWEYTTTLGSLGSYVSMPNVSKFWMYLPVPIAGVAMIVFEIEALYNHIKAFWVKEDKA